MACGLMWSDGPAHAGHDDLRPVDTIVAGGKVYDGTDSPPMDADVAISDDRIVYVGPDAEQRFDADRVIRADGMIVAPGFIDPHTHPNTYIRSDDARKRLNAPWLLQGVTTIVIGADGGGSFDVADDAEWFDKHGVGTNLVPYVGFAPVREKVLGQKDSAPDAEELERMKALVAKGMCEGAFGFSTGLFYAPQSYAKTDEVVALAREAAKRGGIYDTHQRDESSYTIGLVESTREAIEIGRRAGLPVHISHIKALGVDVHGKAGELVDLIEAARRDGQKVTANQYPWLASATSLAAALVPRWAQDGGRSAMIERFKDPESRRRIGSEMRDNLRRRGGSGSLLLVTSGKSWTGKTLKEMAAEWDMDALDTTLRLLEENRRVQVASFNMTDADVEQFMQQPWVTTSSDGNDGHPRQYATFPKKYETYVKEKKTISLVDFIHRSTGLTADILGLDERGYVREGYYADVVVFDPEAYAPKADYMHPRVLSEGVMDLLVNGKPMIRDGKLIRQAAGRVLLHHPTKGSCS